MQPLSRVKLERYCYQHIESFSQCRTGGGIGSLGTVHQTPSASICCGRCPVMARRQHPSEKFTLRARAEINSHFGASAGRADARRRDEGDVGHRRGAATKQMPARRRAPPGCGPQARWLCCSLLTYRPGYSSSLAPRQRAWGPAAKWEVISARALRTPVLGADRVKIDPKTT